MPKPKRKAGGGAKKRTLRRSGSVKRSRARRADWAATLDEDWDAKDYDSVERIMRRDERDRRRRIEEAAVESPPTPADARPPAPAPPPNPDAAAAPPTRTALVTAAAGMSARVFMDGEERPATIRGLLTEIDDGFINPVAVGDRVAVSADGAGAWAIESVAPRKTVLARADPFLAPRRQVIAANADSLLIVASWRAPDFWPELIDRYLIAAGQSGIEPIICVNKADLIDDPRACEDAIRVYRRMGRRTILTSAVSGAGTAELRDALAGKLTVLAGLSGSGKSSLMAAVQPGLDIRVGAISEAHRQGRHTTTQSSLYRLDGGGWVADTPGVREFALAGLTLGELPIYFPEIDEAAASCRFSNCAHLEEPSCAVRAAESSGVVSPSRAASYRAIFDELEV